MKYFEIKFDYTKESVGVFPQSSGMIESYPYRREDSVWNIGRNKNLTPNLCAIQLNNGAKMTDLLSVEVINSYVGLVVSERFRKVLEQCNLPHHKLHYADVLKPDQSTFNTWDYYLFIALETANQYIDFEDSRFSIHLSGNSESRSIEIGNNQQLLATRRTPKTEKSLAIGESIKVDKITLKPSFDWDFFRIEMLSGYLVSEKLKQMIEAENLTGIRLELAEFIVQKEKVLSA